MTQQEILALLNQSTDNILSDQNRLDLIANRMGSTLDNTLNTGGIMGLVPSESTPLQSLGFDTSFGVANEDDEEQVEYLGSQDNKLSRGLDTLKSFLPGGDRSILGGLRNLLNFRDSPMYRPATTSAFGYTPAQLNQMNALGGFYSEPMREVRRRSNRISNMLQRAAADKDYSEKNLQNLMNEFNMGDVDTGAMIQSIKDNAGYEGGFDRSTGNYNDPLSDDTE